VARRHHDAARYVEARSQFSEEELVELAGAIGLIDTWNRVAIGFRAILPVACPRRPDLHAGEPDHVA
jgi:alkylhydroperoxidase family enzyme